jgi:hypothetical protein
MDHNVRLGTLIYAYRAGWDYRAVGRAMSMSAGAIRRNIRQYEQTGRTEVLYCPRRGIRHPEVIDLLIEVLEEDEFVC